MAGSYLTDHIQLPQLPIKNVSSIFWSRKTYIFECIFKRIQCVQKELPYLLNSGVAVLLGDVEDVYVQVPVTPSQREIVQAIPIFNGPFVPFLTLLICILPLISWVPWLVGSFENHLFWFCGILNWLLSFKIKCEESLFGLRGMSKEQLRIETSFLGNSVVRFVCWVLTLSFYILGEQGDF